MFCSKCGRENRDTAKFCTTCGETILEISLGMVLQKRYRVDEKIGSGAMGTLFKAWDQRLHCSHVLKQLILDKSFTPDERREAIARFENEARLLALLKHPNLPRVLDHFEEGGLRFLVMDFVEGEDLCQYVARIGNRGLPEAEVVRVALAVLDALEYLHGLRPPVIHRDVKPNNIMRTRNGDFILVDFGVARTISRRTVTAIGTEAYAPPEQWKGQAEPRSDLYALAATLHHLLTAETRQLPFLFDPLPVKAPHVSATVATTIHRALSLDPHDRFNSAAEMRSALLTGSSVSLAPAPQASLPSLVVPTAGSPVPPSQVPSPPAASPVPPLPVRPPVRVVNPSLAAVATQQGPVQAALPPVSPAQPVGASSPAVSPSCNQDVLLFPEDKSYGTIWVRTTEYGPWSTFETARGSVTIPGRFQVKIALERIPPVGAPLPFVTNLIEFSVKATVLDDESMAPVRLLTGLQTLETRGSRLTDVGMQYLRHLNSLRELRIPQASRVSNAGLVPLGTLTNLEVLDLTASGITTAGLTHFSSLIWLRELNLSMCNLAAPAGLVHLRNLQSLLKLDLSHTNITSAGLGQLQALPFLEELNLCGCDDITDASLPSLRGLTGLKIVYLGSCRNITDVGRSHLTGMANLAVKHSP